MVKNFADRLLGAIRQKKTPICVGIDPVYAQLPSAITRQTGLDNPRNLESSLDAVLSFSRKVIHLVAPIAPAVKINIAYFERYYGEGVDAYMELVQEAHRLGLVVIGDCKRGDVGHTAQAYAQAQLAQPEFEGLDDLSAPDAVTVNSYLGLDGLKPFLKITREQCKGIFALVQTSNESADQIQGFIDAKGLTLAEHVGLLIDRWANEDGLVGQSGYSALGAVVGVRHLEKARRLRALMPRCLFLVPGYGAQGGTAQEVSACFKSDYTGAIVNASRSVIFAYQSDRYKDRNQSWERCVEWAVQDFAKEIVQAIGM